MNRVRLAVVGAGHLGRIHARLAAGIPEIELQAVVDARPEAARAVAAEFGARPVAQLRELVGEVDAAVVATPTEAHLAVAAQLMKSGVHVLVEKPLAPTAAEADELVQLARRSGLVLQVGHVERFNPAFTSALPYLSDAKYVEARRLSPFSFRSTDVGVTLDLMIHDIDATLALVRSEVVAVEAFGSPVLGRHEDMATARLRFANGAVAHLTASRVSYVAERRMQVLSPTRFASIDFAAKKAVVVEPRVDVLDGTFSLEALGADESARLKDRMFDELLVKRDLPTTDANAIADELRDFAAAIRGGTEPRVDGAAGRDAVAVAEEVVRQIQSHDWRTSSRQTPAAQRTTNDESDWSVGDTVILHRKAG